MATYIITDSGNAVTNMANAQAQLDAMLPGDILELTKNVNFDGTLTLPAKAEGSDDIIITTTGTLPAAGTRISPADAGELPKIRVIVNNASAIKTCDPADGVANNYQLIGLELIDNAAGGSTLLNLGSAANLANKQDDVSKVPGFLTVDRCIIRGQSASVGTKRGIALQCHDAEVKECYIYNVFKVGADTQAIGGWNGIGTYTISNNYLEAAGENFMMGGADPYIPNLVPTNLIFTRNDVVKLPAWRGGSFQVKNLFELKNFSNAHIYGNKFFYNWTAAQPGYAVLFTPVNQDGTNNATVVENVLFEYNEIAHVPGGVNITAHDAQASPYKISARTNNITIQNNLFWDMGPTWGNALRAFQMGSGSPANTFEGTNTLIINHNTILGTASMSALLYFYPTSGGVYPQNPNFAFTNNMARRMSFGIKGDSAAEGTTTLGLYASGYDCQKNAIAGANAAIYPGDNFTPDETAFQAAFVDYAAGDWHIDPLSAYHDAGTDGEDLGADIDGISAAYTGEPPPNPDPGGAGAVFCATGDYLSRTTGLPGVGAFTAMCWYEHDGSTPSGSDYRTVFTHGNTEGAYDTWAGIFSNVLTNDFNVSVGAGGSSAFTSAAAIAGSTKTHLAYVRTGTTHRFYVNGILIDSCTLDFSAGTITSVFGASDATVTSVGEHTLSYYREWQSALNAAQIRAEMASRTAVAPSCFTDTPLSSPSDLNDYSGHGHDWTAVGTLVSADGPDIPANTNAGAAEEITELPFSLSVSASVEGVASADLYYKYTSVAGETLGLQVTGGPSPYVPLVNVLIDDGGLTTWLNLFDMIAGNPSQWPTVAGVTYYILVDNNDTTDPDAAVDISLLAFDPATTIPPGPILVIPDSSANVSSLLSSTEDFTPLAYIYPSPFGEGGDILRASGIICVTDDRTNVVALYGDQFLSDLIATAALPGTIKIRAHDPTGRFYLGAPDRGDLFHALVTNLNTDGTIEQSWSLPNAGLKAVAASNDGTLLYLSGQGVPSGTLIVQQYVLETETLTTLVTDTADEVVSDILVLDDDTIVVLYVNTVLTTCTVKRFDAAGALLGSRVLTEHSGSEARLTKSNTPLVSFWAWTHGINEPAVGYGYDGLSVFHHLTIDDDLTIIDEIEGQDYSPTTNPTDIESRFGNPFSCPFMVIPVAIVPPVPPEPGVETRTLKMRWLRRAPHLCEEQTRMRYMRIQFDMRVGNGLAIGQGSDPKVVLRWSDDGGYVWSNEHVLSTGKRGATSTRVQAFRLGMGRDRVFELSGSDPVPTAIVDAYIDVEKGTS